MNKVFGGSVVQTSEREDGQHTITVEPASNLFAGLEPAQDVLLTHGDAVSEVADGFTVNSRHGTVITGMDNAEKKLYAVQFHPEVKLSTHGSEMFANFLFKVRKPHGVSRATAIWALPPPALLLTPSPSFLYGLIPTQPMT
jgi:GMP synthase (glutamine-hydrolysing)